MNIEVPTKYQLSHNDRIVDFENRLHSENLMLYRPALHDN
jgi:ribosomal protein L24